MDTHQVCDAETGMATTPAETTHEGAENTALPRIMMLKEVLELVGVSRPTLYKWTRAGVFPSPRQIGPRRIGWLSTEVESWIRNRPVVR